MKKYLGMMLVAVLLLSGTALASEALVIDGTGDSQEILRRLAARYENLHPGTHIEVPDSVGSGGGIKALLEGRAGLARTARALNSKEAEMGLVQVFFARSPVVFATHSSLETVKTVSIGQVLEIYDGRLDNWKSLGGPDHKLYPVAREEGDSSRAVVNGYLASMLGNQQGMGTVGKVFFTTPDTVLALKRNAYTFGFVPLSEALAAGLHILALDSALPDEQGVRTQTYPLVSHFYLVKPADPSPLALSFIEFILTEPARELMRQQGVFPVDGN